VTRKKSPRKEVAVVGRFVLRKEGQRGAEALFSSWSV